MGEVTNIAWTNATWNPWQGCTKVSPGCDHCYAEALDRRWGRDFAQGNALFPGRDRILDGRTWEEMP